MCRPPDAPPLAATGLAPLSPPPGSARPSSRQASAGWLANRSIAHRNAASVFPEPVGAEIRTCSPDAIAGHACDCAGVGAVNAALNQSRVRGLNCSRDTVSRA